MMNLYEVMKKSEYDYDTYDTEYDACVTVCYIDEEYAEDNYDKFCISIIKKVEVESIHSDSLVCNWSKLIKDNMENFKAFTKEHWRKDCQYDDDEDEFIYQWINEIHAYMAGYVSEDMYEELVELVDSLEV